MSSQLIDAIILVKLVVKQQFSQDLIFTFSCMHFFSYFVGDFVDLASLSPLVARLSVVIVQRRHFLPLTTLTLTLLFDSVLVRPLSLWLLQCVKFFLSALLKPGTRQNVPERKKLLDFEGGHRTARDPVLDARDVQDDLPLNVDALSRRPVAYMFKEASLDVLAVGSNHDPPP